MSLGVSAFTNNFSAWLVSSNCCCLFLLQSSTAASTASTLALSGLGPVAADSVLRPLLAALSCPSQLLALLAGLTRVSPDALTLRIFYPIRRVAHASLRRLLLQTAWTRWSLLGRTCWTRARTRHARLWHLRRSKSLGCAASHFERRRPACKLLTEPHAVAANNSRTG